MMFTSGWLLFYSYTQLAECICIWSGFGVALTGPALYVIYALLLAVPAANVVLQEAVLAQLRTQPLLLLGLMNLFTSLLFAPVLLMVHLLGWEDVGRAFTILTGHPEVYMLVLWLCVQMAAISLVTVGLILLVDSFWTVALRSLRVVFWWGQEVFLFYTGCGGSVMLSISHPHASLWSVVMLCGLGLIAVAAYKDRRADDGEHQKDETSWDLAPTLARHQSDKQWPSFGQTLSEMNLPSP